ncbi:GPO family capsid scaffolding protein, partial [Salmonella enterica subsp. diarizonae]|nr:GPO family capsid scaffolding protein [Salmonella enterica subsp. diarizonae]
MTYQKKSADDQPQTIGEVSAKLGDIMNQVKNFGEDVAKKMQAGETVTEELKQRTDESLTQMAELKERLTELEQKSARRQDDLPQTVKTLG